METIPGGTILYRALRAASWLNKDTKEILPPAFLRRLDGDEQGLSINYNCLLYECAPSLRKLKGICSLAVDDVRQLELDAKPDGRNQRVPHGNIVGLPLPLEDEMQAEQFAEALAQLSKPEWIAQSKSDLRPPRDG